MGTATASDSGGTRLRFRMVGLLTCRLPHPHCLLSRSIRIARYCKMRSMPMARFNLNEINRRRMRCWEPLRVRSDDLQRPDRPGIAPEFPVALGVLKLEGHHALYSKAFLTNRKGVP